MTNDLQQLAGRRALVLGGTGFVGARLVERLVREYGAHVRVLVRDFATAARIARFPVELVRGDVRDRSAVERAAEGCDVMFHCAFGNWRTSDDQRDITVNGTEAALAAALAARVPRVVYVSTLSVYGLATDGPLDESAARRRSNTPYGDAKLEAEEVALSYVPRGLGLSIIQPTVIYGPYGPNWTIEPLRRLQRAGQILINGGSGYCNAVFVDDLVTGLLLAAVRPSAVGETFLISGAAPVTWAEFIGHYSRMVGGGTTVSLTSEEALAQFKSSKRVTHLPQIAMSMLRQPGTVEALATTPEFRWSLRTAKVVLPSPVWRTLKRRVKGGEPDAVSRATPVPPPPSPRPNPIAPADIALFAAKQEVRIDKARRVLGYEPAFSVARGMDAVERWARWSGLIH
jgi:nucleoside-diphosphate-sugar epimerase